MAEGSFWAVLTAPILESKDLSDGAKLFYAQISRYCGANGYCWKTNAALAEDLGIGERSVSRYVADLESAGFIQTEAVGIKGRRKRWERRIRMATPAPFSLAKSGEVKVAKIGDVKVAKNGEVNLAKIGEDNNESNKAYNTPPIAPQPGGEGDEMFERFWALYPRRVGKQAALRAWRKLKPDRALCTVMGKALKRQMASDDWQRDGGRFVPYPSTWLNGRRWEDELPETPAAAMASACESEAFGQWH